MAEPARIRCEHEGQTQVLHVAVDIRLPCDLGLFAALVGAAGFCRCGGRMLICTDAAPLERASAVPIVPFGTGLRPDLLASARARATQARERLNASDWLVAHDLLAKLDDDLAQLAALEREHGAT